MKTTINEDRAELGKRAVLAGNLDSGENDEQTSLTDTLAHIFHYAAAQDLDVSQAIDRARDHYRAEAGIRTVKASICVVRSCTVSRTGEVEFELPLAEDATDKEINAALSKAIEDMGEEEALSMIEEQDPDSEWEPGDHERADAIYINSDDSGFDFEITL